MQVMIKGEIMSKSWTVFMGFLFIFIILYIIILNGFVTHNSVNNCFTTLDDNTSTKFKLPKPVYFSTAKDIIEEENKETTQTKSSFRNIKQIESRPRNTTDYEKGHKDVCKNTWQEDYTKLHQHLLDSNQNKFNIFKCPGSGWGNRLRDLLSAFHFAVIAKRAFIVNCNNPSSLDRYLAPRNIKWNYKVNETKLTVKRGRRVVLNDIKNPSDPKVFEQMLNYSVEYGPGLVGNKHQFLADNLKYDLPVWPNLGQMMGCSFYYLFKKSDLLQQRLDEWKEKLGYNQNIVIGIHVRHGDSVFHHNQGDKRISMGDLDFSFDCAAQIQTKVEEKYHTKKVIWFLAADSNKTKEYAKQKYGDKLKSITGAIEHVGHSSKGNGDAGHLSMFLDYFLLQEADYRLYAGPSSFDSAIDYITLGTKSAGTSWYMKKRHCLIPPSLKS